MFEAFQKILNPIFSAISSSLSASENVDVQFFAAIASKHHPSNRAERFPFGGACEWLLAIAAWKTGIKSVPAGHSQNGFDLVQFKAAMQGLWSVKSSASTTDSKIRCASAWNRKDTLPSILGLAAISAAAFESAL